MNALVPTTVTKPEGGARGGGGGFSLMELECVRFCKLVRVRPGMSVLMRALLFCFVLRVLLLTLKPK